MKHCSQRSSYLTAYVKGLAAKKRLASLKHKARIAAAIGLLGLSACQKAGTASDPTGLALKNPEPKSSETKAPENNATPPGAPGAPPTWSFAGKRGIGTAYEAYKNGEHSDNASTGKVSRVWFSLAQGILTETMYGSIDAAQIQRLEVLVVDEGRVEQESIATDSHIDYLHKDSAGRPLSLAYKLVNRAKSGHYEIEKHFFTHPERDALFMRLRFQAHKPGLKAYLYLNPHVANSGGNDSATAKPKGLFASEGDTTVGLIPAEPFAAVSAGFVGYSDGLSQLQQQGELQQHYVSSGPKPGNVALIGQLDNRRFGQFQDFILGFGRNPAAVSQLATASFKEGYQAILDHYNGVGAAVGWQDYLASLSALPQLQAQAHDGGKLVNASALVLKAQEDKHHSGALIASLSNPWGDSADARKPQTGYKAVWPRDFYQCAMAMLALGDTQTPLVAFRYLQQVQVSASTPGNKGSTGWFLQKTHVDGSLEWVAVQLDQSAMPLMLAWKLWQQQLLDTPALDKWYRAMLQDAANFLSAGGQVNLDWNQRELTPPFTQQERWEEQEGYSPSTLAAVVTGLVAAADIATHLGKSSDAEKYLTRAKTYAASIEASTFTTQGPLGNGRYYLRISQNQNPNDHGLLLARNGRGELKESDILDGGFLELVRYGLRPANDPYIVDSLAELDNTELPEALRVKYQFHFAGEKGTFPGWRRYGHDGYGEDKHTGTNYGEHNGEMSPGQRGRVWPFLTGERGHYELARLLQNTEKEKTNTKTAKPPVDFAGPLRVYVRALELFANEGLMLPEQVWDGVGANQRHQYKPGEGTNSATPLAWSHAEYIKLLRSISDAAVWDYYPIVPAALER